MSYEGRNASPADIRAAISPGKARDIRLNQWPVHFLVLPISWFVTIPFIRLGVSANSVSLLNGLMMLCLPAVAYIGADWSVWAVAAGLYVFQLLDCVDGYIARFTQTQSAFGAFLDSVVDQFARMCGYASIGVLVQQNAAFGALDLAAVALIVGLAAAWFAAAAKLARTEDQAVSGGGSILNAPEAGALGLGDRFLCFLVGIDYLTFLLVPVCALAGVLDLFLLWLLVYSVADYLLTLYLVAGKRR